MADMSWIRYDKNGWLIGTPFLAFLLVVPLLGAEVVSSRPEPLGTLVDVGGYRVHIYCTGQGSPTVVVASGDFSFDWALVQPRVAQFTRVCTYDPSGTAWSDRVESADRITCGDRVSELHKLLKSAAINGPYVTVGFSIGGLVARLYAAQYPSEIAGMVLVDHAFIDARDSPELTANSKPAGGDVDSPPVLIFKTPSS